MYRLDRFWLQGSGDLPREQFESIRAQLLKVTTLGMGSPPKRLWLLAAGYTLFFGWLLSTTRLPWPIIVMWGAVVGGFLWAAITYSRRIPKAGRVLIAAALIRQNRCASCAYDLRNVPRDEDGLSVCPECGAAWRVTSGVVLPAKCDLCDYDLRGLPLHVTICPECGKDHAA